MSDAPDPRRCPLCGEPNACALAAPVPGAAAGVPDCWCAHLAIDREVLSRVPEAVRGHACICRRCAEQGPSSA